ncbi:unnamed protein product [Citrullus colocynthis]|uniref:Uncharacterized protein n=1 Tax=Citrullus colocynthis TaxID=252529 RepID=A0ABP0Z4D9_9ROSI
MAEIWRIPIEQLNNEVKAAKMVETYYETTLRPCESNVRRRKIRNPPVEMTGDELQEDY